MGLACHARERSTCPRLQVGAIIVNNNRIKATGYNGSAPGADHCSDVGCDDSTGRCLRTIHAEVNAINDTHLRDRCGSTIYTTAFPCMACAKKIVLSGITEVVYMQPYKKSDMIVNMLHKHSIVVRQYILELLLVEG